MRGVTKKGRMGISEFDGEIEIGTFGDVHQKMRGGLRFGTVRLGVGEKQLMVANA